MLRGTLQLALGEGKVLIGLLTEVPPHCAKFDGRKQLKHREAVVKSLLAQAA